MTEEQLEKLEQLKEKERLIVEVNFALEAISDELIELNKRSRALEKAKKVINELAKKDSLRPLTIKELDIDNQEEWKGEIIS